MDRAGGEERTGGPARRAAWRRAAVALALLAVVPSGAARAQARAGDWHGLYDMNAMMAQPHPFTVAPAAYAAPPVPVPPRPTLDVSPAASSRVLYPVPALAEASPQGGGWRIADWVSEVRVGLFAHDTGPFSAREERGVDGNLEILFPSPGFLSIVWSPRPHLGVSVNSARDTSQAYFGLTWEYAFAGRWFVEASFGGMVHNGHLVGRDDDGNELGKSLGCRVLFRESLGVGVRFGAALRHSVIAHFDHSSNAGLCKKNTADGTENGRQIFVVNEGIESVGLQYGYRF